MEAPSEQIRGLYAKANAAERQQIHEQLRDLQNELYTDWEVMFGIGMGVSRDRSPIPISLL